MAETRPRAGCAGYSSVTRKSYLDNEILTPVYSDYSGVTRKSDLSDEIGRDAVLGAAKVCSLSS